MKRLLPYMEKYKVYAILTPILMVLEVTADIFLPYLMAKIVDVGVANRDVNYIFKTGGLMLLLAFAAMGFGVLSAIFGSKAGHGFASELRKETFSKIQGFSFGNLDNFTLSSLVTRLTNDITTIGQVCVTGLRIGFRSPFMMLFALLMAINISGKLTLVFMIAVPLSAIVMYCLLKKARPLFVKLQYQTDRINGRIKENLTAIGVVKSFNRAQFEKKKFKKNNSELKDTAIQAITTITLMNPLLNMIMYATIISVLWFGGQQVVIGGMGSGELISFITYITQVLMSLMVLSTFFMQLMRAVASKDRIIEVWDTYSDIVEVEDAVSTIQNGDIEFKNVSFKYNEDSDYVLKDINLKLHAGETVGIIGATGSSKSTLVQLIPRLYDASSGDILVGNVNVKDYSTKALRDEVAFVLQENVLFSGSLKDNMYWGNKDAGEQQMIDSLEKSCAWEFVNDYEDGLDHIVEERGNNFSGGQKQRLCIARALMKNPKILILDDSTSAVDMDTDAKIQASLKENLSDITKIIIGQRITSIEHADRIIVMHEGSIYETGTHNELLKNNGIYKEIYDSQQRGSEANV